MSDANDDEECQFGFANIPFGVVSTKIDGIPKSATRLFNKVFLIPDLIHRGLLDDIQKATQTALLQPKLNNFASLGRSEHRKVREALKKLLSDGNAGSPQVDACSVEVSEVRYHVPVTVGDFSDFSCSTDHVLNAGEAVMGARQLPPGFLHFPPGYSGRSSSILPPGTSVRRPRGQYRTPDGIAFGLSRAVDFELEVAAVVGKPSQITEPIDIGNAEDHIFGFLLLNDWSARDIQALEMNPLGPFNGKSFGTSISPWIVTIDALEPFRAAAPTKQVAPAAYLQNPRNNPHFAIQLSVEIEAEGQRHTVCQSRFEWLYWTISDMIAHQTINGCPLNAGDFLATGTVSGSTRGSYGCLLEITKGGKEPVALVSSGKTMGYLEDGAVVRLTGFAGQPGTPNYVGFGSCWGRLCEGTQT